MDLYRILRQSLYLMVGAGAFSLSIAEQNLWYLIAAVFFGLLALELLDSGRFKPAQREFVAAMTLALFVYSLMVPLREENGWEKHYPAAFAHFLFAFQILLLFTAYNDWVLILIGISSLAIVIISGVIDHNATLFLRMACFVALTAWTLFIHSLWRSRENYTSSQSQRMAAMRHSPALDVARGISERALMQGVSMTAILSGACLVLGLVLFFSAPRLERISGWLESWTRGSGKANIALPGGRDSDGKSVGYSPELNLNDMGNINENQGEALSVTIPKYTKDLADSNGNIYLRGAVFCEQRGGKWFKPQRYGRTLEAEKDKPIQIEDPSYGGIVFNRPLIAQIVENTSTHSRQYLAVAPVARLMAPAVELDEEGAMHLPQSQFFDKYEVWSYLPRHEAALPDNVKAEHPYYTRYMDEKGLQPDAIENVRKRALEITARCNTDLEKARAIRAYLRDSRLYSYTKQLQELHRKGDPIHDFLLNESEKERRGHCGYFASAFVVLCRLNHLPARLATGYSTPLPSAAEDDSVRVVFKNSDAHAWGEVFFKDYGWIVFDPTPGESERPVEAQTPPAKPKSTPATTPPSDANTITDMWNRGVIEFSPEDQHQIYDKVAGGLLGARGIFSGNSSGGWGGALLAWACTGLFLYWLMQLYLRRGQRRVARGGAGVGRAHAAVSFYNDLLQVLSRRGFVRRPGQTPREFAEHVVRLGGEPFKSVMLVTDVFETVRYGGAEMSQDEFNALQTALDGLRELTFASAAPAAKS